MIHTLVFDVHCFFFFNWKKKMHFRNGESIKKYLAEDKAIGTLFCCFVFTKQHALGIDHQSSRFEKLTK